MRCDSFALRRNGTFGRNSLSSQQDVECELDVSSDGDEISLLNPDWATVLSVFERVVVTGCPAAAQPCATQRGMALLVGVCRRLGCDSNHGPIVRRYVLNHSPSAAHAIPLLNLSMQLHRMERYVRSLSRAFFTPEAEHCVHRTHASRPTSTSPYVSAARASCPYMRKERPYCSPIPALVDRGGSICRFDYARHDWICSDFPMQSRQTSLPG